MRDGNLCQISTVKRIVDLDSPMIWPIYLVPYRAGPNTRGFERSEIENMLGMSARDPTQFEWDSPVLFAPKRTEL